MENSFDKNGLSVEKSLEIISEAINNSQRDFQRRAGTAMTIWGAAVMLASGIVMLGIALTGNPMWNIAWFLIPVIGWPLDKLSTKHIGHSSGSGENFISKTMGIVWIIYGVFAVATSIMAFFIPIPIIGIIILLLGMGGAITGALAKNRLITVLGIISGIAGLPCAYLLDSPVYTPLLLTAAALMNLVIPGLIFNRQNRKLQ
ncbi:MAG TPA: hypothetical protein IAC03_05010 [Candidatus Coprenecus pullistercoris]|nr:hypothetical protein [Candidatus Coprenecus pullistercoris]